MNRRPVMVAATEFRDGATGSGIAGGFRQLGWLVQQVDRGEFCRGAKTFALRVASRVSRDAMEKAYRDAIWHECEALRPDVFFTVKGSGLTAELLSRIRQLGARTVMYYPDVAFEHARVDQDSFAGYDLFVTTKSFQLEWLGERLGAEHVAYVPHGYTDAVFQPVFDSLSGQDYVFDVLYMGNHSPYKQQWLEQLLQLCPGLNLGVVGNRWREQKSPLRIPMSSMLGEVRSLNLARLIQSSRINIALHFGTTDSGWEDLVSTRTFEIPACKGFMLHIDNPEIRQFFDVGHEIDVFTSPETLHEKIQFYLAHSDRRAQMVERAYAKSSPAYGYASRAVEVDRLMRSQNWAEVSRVER